MSNYEIKIDLSRCSIDRFDLVVAELIKNGYEVYLSCDSMDNFQNSKILCIMMTDANVNKLREEK